jgi:hypothetical protein
MAAIGQKPTPANHDLVRLLVENTNLKAWPEFSG